MLGDSHCHLASRRFRPDEVPSLIQSARDAGVSWMVTLATSLNDLHTNLAIASDPAVHACLGIHPCDVHHAPDHALAEIATHTSDPRVCAIGETGLDYYHPPPDGWNDVDFRERQRDFLHQHFQLAASTGLNVVIHTRDAAGHASFHDALAIYQNYHHAVRAVFHCFAGPWEHARLVLDLGGVLSFGGVATFKNASLIRDVASRCPAGSFMVETDAPYLAPEPHRGKRNEPAFARHTADFLATLRNEPPDVFAKHTAECASAFFRFRSSVN